MVDVYTMKDGRKVTVDYSSVKSIMSVKKEDWKEIRQFLQECLDYVNSSQYTIDFLNKLFPNAEFSKDGKCLTIYRNY